MAHSDHTLAQEDARSAIDELINSALAYNTPGRFHELMQFARRMPRVAPYNVMLLHVQNPLLTYAATVKEWAVLGRKVKPGARPYIVLKFKGPVSFVFNITDTTGTPLPPAVQREIEDPFTAIGTVDAEAWADMITLCAKLRIQVVESPMLVTLAGFAGQSSAGGADYRIELNETHDLPTRFTTLAHELGHLFCGHCGKRPTDFWEERNGLAKATEELEAEAVAYLVASRRKLTTASEKYLSGYLQPGDTLPPFSMEHILTAAHVVEELASGKLPAREKARKQRERDRARKAITKAKPADEIAPKPDGEKAIDDALADLAEFLGTGLNEEGQPAAHESPSEKQNDLLQFRATSPKTPEQWARILASRAKHLPEVFVTY